MKTQNQINSLIYSDSFNNTASIVITPPSQTNTILIVLSKGKTTGNSAFIIQTAASNGIFDTSGYVTGVIVTASNNNAWFNDSVTNGLYLTGSNNTGAQYSDSSVYVSGFNTNFTASCYGTSMNNNPPTTYFVAVVGQSPTTLTTQIKILTASGTTMASGAIKIYSVV